MNKEKMKCVHCGTPFKPTPQRPDFCCAGCQFVYDLIRENNLENYYNLQDGKGQPISGSVFQHRDYEWINLAVAMAEEKSSGSNAEMELDLQGITCVGCVWLIERLFSKYPGAISSEVDSSSGRVRLKWTKRECDLVGFAKRIQGFGYLLGPAGKTEDLESSALVKRLGLCAAFAMNVMLFTLPFYLGLESSTELGRLFERLQFVFTTLSVFVGGAYFIGRSIKSLRCGVLHIDLPISLGIIAAYGASILAWQKSAEGFIYFDFVAIFTCLMLTGRWLQLKAVERNRALLLSLRPSPPEVIKMQAGHKSPSSDAPKIPVETLRAQDLYAVLPGRSVPVKSRLESEGTTLGLEWINGESEPRVARSGQLIPSGATVVGQSPAVLTALESWQDSVLASLMEAKPREAFRNIGLERFIRVYLMIVLGIATLGGIGWLLYGAAPLFILQVITSILVVSCPCASGVALPMIDDLAVAQLRRCGIFVKEPSLWVRLLNVRKILFDKTGTLTLENMALRNPETLNQMSPESRQSLLAGVAEGLHPVSCCLREELLSGGTRVHHVVQVKEELGMGIEWKWNDKIWRLGRPEWALESTPKENHDAVLSCERQKIAGFLFGDEIRHDAVEEVASLKELGYEVYILSGDRQEKVDRMASSLGIPNQQCIGAMTPDGKQKFVENIDQRDTLMIGDGANDSLAFNASFCTGTPAVDRGLLEHKSDFYFLGRGLAGVRHLLQAAKVRKTATRRVVGFAITYNIAVVGLSLAGWMNPLVAAVLMPSSSLVSLAIVSLSRYKV